MRDPMPSTVHPPSHDSSRRIYFALAEDNDSRADSSIAEESADYLRRQLAAAAAAAPVLPALYDELAGWIAGHAQAAGSAYRQYLAERKNGSRRRHFGNAQQALQFLCRMGPARLVDGASLYGVLERWDDSDFRPLIARYLEQLGNGVPDRNRTLIYRELMAFNGCPPWRELDDAAFTEGAVELALACHGEHFLPELIGYNLAHQQPRIDELVARRELDELGIAADAFAADPGSPARGQATLHSLRGILQRVADSGEFYRRVRDGYRLHDLVARLPLPTAAAGASSAQLLPLPPIPEPLRRPHGDSAAPARRHGYAERAVIRHQFPSDEHAWEAIGSELTLLEARLAASDSKEEAMGTLTRLLSPAQQHTAAGLMATRIFSQLFNL